MKLVETSAMSDEQLAQFMQENGISLQISEVRMIHEKLGRDPTLTELHIFNIEWSEHCSYKSSKHILKTLPTQAPNVILGPSEDAGIIQFTEVDGEMYGLALRQESHNHPSHIVPYEGAATGIGGIVRDILCMGAKVVGLGDPLRFGNPEKQKTKYIATTVVEGIAGYGNAIGIPNLCGDVYFNDSYDDNCLVNVACLGIVKECDIIHSYAPKDCAGYDVILVGKATDSSGFGGAAFASLVMDEEASNKSAVQVPDPFLKNVIIQATYSVFQEVRKQQIDVGFKDCGAGGIMCATSELGAASNVGMKIHIDAVPVSMQMHPSVTACSETQERLVWVVPKSFTPTLLRIYNKDFQLPEVAEGAKATVIGEATKERDYIITSEGERICDAPIEEVTEGVSYERAQKERVRELEEPQVDEPNYDTILLDVLGHPNVASKRKAFKHYDTEVQGNAVIRAGEADAGVIKPLENSDAAVAMSSDCNPMHGRISPYYCAVNAVAECMRNLAAVGAVPSGFTNCLNFGNPENPEVLWEFAEAVRGITDACEQMPHKEHGSCVPIISGNVSFYNESKTGSAVDPSPHISGLGILKDYRNATTLQLKAPRNTLCMIGERKDELGGSIYYQLHGHVGKNVPVVNFAEATKEIHTMIELIEAGVVQSCHDISDGGVAAALAEMVLGSEGNGTVGATVTFETDLRTDKLLFSETGGFVFETDDVEAVRKICDEKGLALYEIGATTDENALRINHGSRTIAHTVPAMAERWLNGFEEALE